MNHFGLKGKVKFYFRKSCWKLNCGNSSCYRAIDMAVILRNIRCAHQKVSDKALLKKILLFVLVRESADKYTK